MGGGIGSSGGMQVSLSLSLASLSHASRKVSVRSSHDSRPSNDGSVHEERGRRERIADQEVKGERDTGLVCRSKVAEVVQDKGHRTQVAHEYSASQATAAASERREAAAAAAATLIVSRLRSFARLALT